MQKIASFVGILLSMQPVCSAFADVVLHFTVTSSQGARPEIVLLSDQFVRIESGLNASDGTVQFDARSGKLGLFDHQHRTYTELSAADIERLTNSSQSSWSRRLDEIELAAAHWPAAEREALQDLRARLQQTAQPPALSGTPNVRIQVAGFSCTPFEVRRSASRREQYCLSDAVDLGLSAEEYAGIRGFLQITTRLAGDSALTDLQGIPVRSVHEDDDERYELLLERVERTPLPTTRFTLPTDYVRQPAERF